jgi:hypothetical protein
MNAKLTSILLIAAALSSGCGYKMRNITAQSWDAQGSFYLGYWEGNCGFTGCDAGDGKVQYCQLQDSNQLLCKDQAAINDMLARKNKK